MSIIDGVYYSTKLDVVEDLELEAGDILLQAAPEIGSPLEETLEFLLASETAAPKLAPGKPLTLPTDEQAAEEAGAEPEPEAAEPVRETSGYVQSYSSPATAPGTQAGNAKQKIFPGANGSRLGALIIGNDIPPLFAIIIIEFEGLFELVPELREAFEDEDVFIVFVFVPPPVEEFCPEIQGVELILNNMDFSTIASEPIQGPVFVDPEGNFLSLEDELGEETRILVDASDLENPIILLDDDIPEEVPEFISSFVIGSDFDDTLIGRIVQPESLELVLAGGGNDLIIGEKRLGIQEILDNENSIDIERFIELLGLDPSRYPGGDNEGSLIDSLHGEDCHDTIYGEYEQLGMQLTDVQVIVGVENPGQPP